MSPTLSLSPTWTTAEASASLQQVLNEFSANLPAELPDTVSISAGYSLLHPVGRTAAALIQKPRGRISRKDDRYYLFLPLDYLAWAQGGWVERVWLAHALLSTRLKKLPTKHFIEADRDALIRATDRAAWTTATCPPQRIEVLGHAYRLAGGGISYGQPAPGQGQATPIALKEIEAYVATPPEPRRAKGFKRYRRQDGQLFYWEAWLDESGVVEHRGVCGSLGVTEQLLARDPFAVLDERCRLAEASGYRPIPISAHKTIRVHLQASNNDVRALLDRRHALEDWLNELLGWRGLGECDGGETDGVTATAFCLSVDGRLGKSIIAEALAKSPFSDARVTA